mmetsp:Transcript_6228/g.16253  ORF Transcript_6228/g.16253 Transcript_6228/m.16253 type:complete len:203 (+) Transcript_6228:402-1010(+)
MAESEGEIAVSVSASTASSLFRPMNCACVCARGGSCRAAHMHSANVDCAMSEGPTRARVTNRSSCERLLSASYPSRRSKFDSCRGMLRVGDSGGTRTLAGVRVGVTGRSGEAVEGEGTARLAEGVVAASASISPSTLIARGSVESIQPHSSSRTCASMRARSPSEPLGGAGTGKTASFSNDASARLSSVDLRAARWVAKAAE